MFDIREYGALPNWSAPCTSAIQRAIDAAHGAGGGTVLIPAGEYLSGSLQIKSHVTLRLESGARLNASYDYRDYAFTRRPAGWAGMAGLCTPRKMCGFVWAEDAEDVGIEGAGVIDGRCVDHTYFPNAEDEYHRRPHLALFVGCRDVRATGVTLENPGMFSFYAVACDHVRVDGVTVRSWRSENGDGVDFDGTSDVVVANCLLETGDDGISLKTCDPSLPCLRYAITNCVFRSVWAGIRLGTESSADMRDICVSNCVFEHCNDGLKIQTCSHGTYENLRISNCVMRDVHRPLFMTRSRYRLSAQDASIRPEVGALRGVVISNLTAYVSAPGTDYHRNGFVISGAPGYPIEDITLRDVRVVFPGGTFEAAERVDTPEYLDYSFLYPDIFSINGEFPSVGPFVRHVDGLRLIDCRFECVSPDARGMFFLYKSSLRVRGLEISGSRAGLAVDTRTECADCTLDGAALSRFDELPARLAPKLRAFEAATAETDAKFDAWAREIDRAERMEKRERIPLSAWTKDGSVWTARVSLEGSATLLLWLQGDAVVRANGEVVGQCALPELYRNLVLFPCRLHGRGETEIQVEWLDPSQRAGADCLLPFGEFRPFPAALINDPILCEGITAENR